MKLMPASPLVGFDCRTAIFEKLNSSLIKIYEIDHYMLFSGITYLLVKGNKYKVLKEHNFHTTQQQL